MLAETFSSKVQILVLYYFLSLVVLQLPFKDVSTSYREDVAMHYLHEYCM